MDPLTGSYAMLTPYQFASNRPIDGIDLDGQEVDLSGAKVNLWEHSSGDAWYETGLKVLGNATKRVYNDLVAGEELYLNNKLLPQATMVNTVNGVGGALQKSVEFVETTTKEKFVDDVQQKLETPATYEIGISFLMPGVVAKGAKLAKGSKLAATTGKLGKVTSAKPQTKAAKPPCTNCGSPKAASNPAKLCFIAGTAILTEMGLTLIEDIVEGDMVWAFSDSLGTKTVKPVLQTIQNEAQKLTSIVVGLDTIHCTPEHPFYVDNTWIEAGDLKVADELVLFDGTYVQIDTLWTRDTTCTVYNFEVEDFHTYFVGESGVLVHNNTCFDRNLVSKRIGTKQQKHLRGTNNYKQERSSGRSPSVITTNAQTLLDQFHTGKFKVISDNPAKKSIKVQFDQPIGDVYDQAGNLIKSGTQIGTIKYGKNVHIVPVAN